MTAAEEYAQRLMEVSIAQICQDVGFDVAKTSTTETLVDIARRYIELVGEKCSVRAQAAGRTAPNVFDLDCAFDEVGVKWEDMHNFYRETKDLKFPHVAWEPQPRHMIYCLPAFKDNGKDIRKDGVRGRSENVPGISANGGDEKVVSKTANSNGRSRGEHIPDFLPPFPDEHTFRMTDDIPKRNQGREVKQRKVKQNSQVEKSLTNLNPDDGNIEANYLEPGMGAASENTIEHWGSVNNG
mmetsp:Transcript_33627/g.81451  ORF Transcript_33627/g.81451 Transcript_33627/m.81451 type:complete len:240 (-) Transcript_33627:288-1007(-)